MWVIVYPHQLGVPKYWLYAWTTAEPSSTPLVDTPPHWQKRTIPPPLTPAYLFHSAQDTDAPVQIPAEAPVPPWTARPLTVSVPPRSTWILYQTGAPNENSVAPEEPGRETWIPRPLRLPQIPATLYYYTAGFFRDSAVEQPDVPPWIPRFLPPSRLVSPTIQALYYFGQDTSETAPSEQPYWIPPPVNLPIYDTRFGFLWNAASDTGSVAPEEPGRDRWVPRPLRSDPLPLGLHFYQRQGKESDQTTPENIQGTRDTWRPQTVRDARPPRSTYLYYFSGTAQDVAGPAPEVGRDQWRPQWVRVEVLPRGVYLYYRSDVTSDITFAAAQEPGWHGWTPKPLTISRPPVWLRYYYQSNTAQDTSSALRIGRVTGLVDKPWHTTTIVR